MKKPLPANEISHMDVWQDDKTGDDYYEGPCVDKGFVQGLAAGGMEKVARRGELIVKHADGIEHTFDIIAHHGYPILEDMYTLLGTVTMDLTKFLPCHNIEPKVQTQYWVIGRRLSDGKFEKVSMLEMDNEEVKRLHTLRNCRNTLSEYSHLSYHSLLGRVGFFAANTTSTEYWPAFPTSNTDFLA